MPGPFGFLRTGIVPVFCAAVLAAAASGAHAGTLRVLAVRADFVPDADSSVTTGDGTFLLEPDGWDGYDVDFDELPFDPPPHDGRYFEQHLRAARTYLQTVSYGAQDITWHMVPAHPDSVLHLPRKMREYYSKRQASSIRAGDMQLISIIKDAFGALDSAAARAGSTFASGGYDAFIVFHAGADGRNDADGGTYSDIPSKYVSLQRYGDSVRTADGTVIRDCILLPETVTQDGRTGTLNGVLAYELGHQLGLPSMFYTEESANHGVPAVGYFSLMDVGGNIPDSGETYVYGTVPPLPGPWERIRLGWVEPVVLRTGQDGRYTVNPAAVTAESSVYKIPISDHEYFLLENRQRLAGAAADTPYVVDTATGVIMAPSPFIDTAAGDTLYGYDALLPGDGIVIWHVDEQVVDYDAVPPVVNYNIDRQGIDIIEADGREDLGYVYTYGAEDDMFRSGDRFTPYTDPASRSRSGAYTGITITDIDTAGGARMAFTLAFGRLRPGWPVRNDTAAAVGPVCADINGDGMPELFTATAAGTLFAWRADGKGLLDTVTGIFARLSAGPAGALAAGDIDGNDTLELVVADVAGTLHVFGTHGSATVRSRTVLGDACTGHPVLAGPGIYQGTADGCVYLVAGDSAAAADTFGTPGAVRCAAGFVNAAYGSLCVAAVHADGLVRLYGPRLDTVYWETALDAAAPFAPVICDLDRDSLSELIVIAGGAFYVLGSDGTVRTGWPAGSGLRSAPVIGDLDGNGYPDMYSSAGGYVYGFNRTGAALSGYPRTLDRNVHAGLHATAPVLGNVDDADGDELVVGAPGADITMFRGIARIADDWPLSTGSGNPASGVLLCDLDGNDTTDVVAVTPGGTYAWEMNVPAGGQWPMEAHDSRRSGYYGPLPPVDVRAGDLLSPAYNYPNPVKNGRTVIRYRVGRPGSAVSVKLFDYAGELVDSFDGPAVPYEYNEIPYDVTAIQSGVYHCRVEAKGPSGTQVRFFRMAVVR